MFAVADRIFETSVTVGAGTYTLDGAQVGFQPFSVLGANNDCTYFATDDTNWEVGIGTVLAGPNRLQRTTILASSNAGAAVNWAAGTRKLRAGLPAAGIIPKRRVAKAVGGGADVALTTDEQRRDALEFTGVLTADINVTVDATVWAWASVFNNTTGAFKLTFKVAGLVGVAIPQGTRAQVFCDGTDVRRADIAGLPLGLLNGTIAHSRAGNAETIAVKTYSGSDPSPSDPVLAVFRDTAAGTGGVTILPIVAALSLVLSSGSTVGFTNAVTGKIWAVVFNDAGTPRLGVINCLSTVAAAGAGRDVTSIYPLGQQPVASSTAEGGAGAADNAQVFYTGVAVAAKPYCIAGNLEYTLAAAGTWNTAPGKVQLYSANVPLPGQVLQVQRTDTGVQATGTTTIPLDDSIPQSGEGDQYMSQAITPSSAANVLAVDAEFCGTGTAAPNTLIVALYQDAVANALKAAAVQVLTNNDAQILSLEARVLAGTAAATTFKVRAGMAAAGSVGFNGTNVTRRFGGAYNSWIEVSEVMA
jgi:hypothetical protein